MKTIDTLVEDIHKVFQLPHEFTGDRLERFSSRLSKAIATKINITQGKPTLRMSNIGSKCSRQLWYKINKPNDAEELPVHARIKFLYGDILEELLLFLAEEAGHTVEGCQDTLEINGIYGHRDAVIDGVLVDCKSASTYGFKKFKNHLTPDVDDFGYIPQLESYLSASRDDPLVTDKTRAAFLVIDKTLGHICLDVHTFKEGKNLGDFYESRKELVSSTRVPERAYSDEPDGKSGNRKLGIACQYCSHRGICWPDVRTFVYSTGPVFLTKVIREPRVEEVP